MTGHRLPEVSKWRSGPPRLRELAPLGPAWEPPAGVEVASEGSAEPPPDEPAPALRSQRVTMDLTDLDRAVALIQDAELRGQVAQALRGALHEAREGGDEDNGPR